jgi:hypothetical protein
MGFSKNERRTAFDESRFIRHCLYRSTQRFGFAELWPLWIERWGKVEAADALLAAMCDFEARYQDLKELVRLRKALQREKRRKK